MSDSPYLTFLSDQTIPCTNKGCLVQQFRMRVHMDATENGKPKWSIDRLDPRCPSCDLPNHSVKDYQDHLINVGQVRV